MDDQTDVVTAPEAAPEAEVTPEVAPEAPVEAPAEPEAAPEAPADAPAEADTTPDASFTTEKRVCTCGNEVEIVINAEVLCPCGVKHTV